jgi:glucose-6-phosphate isomerase
MNRIALPRVRLDYGNCMRARLGTRRALSPAALKPHFRRGAKVLAELLAEIRAGRLPFAELPWREDLARQALRAAHRHVKRFDTLLLLGMGGSALGARALIEALSEGVETNGPHPAGRVRILDTLEPGSVQNVLRKIDPRRTLVNIVSRSGDTLETVALFELVRARFERALGAAELPRHLLFTVGPGGGALGEWAASAGAEVLEMPEQVPGRFSVLGQAALLPAAFAGANIRAVLAGASAMADICHLAPPHRNPAFVSAVVLVTQASLGRRQQVVLHYGRTLRGLAAWYAHLWAESLAKRVNPRRKRIDLGQMPIIAEGPTDQQSLLQRLSEGPDDELVVFWEVERHADEGMLPETPAVAANGAMARLAGRSLGDLMRLEKRATAVALTRAGRPNLTWVLPELTPHVVGQLVYVLEYQTVAAARLLGINAFDQPAVEFGEQVTAALLGSSTKADTRRWIRRAGGPDPRCLV